MTETALQLIPEEDGPLFHTLPANVRREYHAIVDHLAAILKCRSIHAGCKKYAPIIGLMVKQLWPRVRKYFFTKDWETFG